MLNICLPLCLILGSEYLLVFCINLGGTSEFASLSAFSGFRTGCTWVRILSLEEFASEVQKALSPSQFGVLTMLSF